MATVDYTPLFNSIRQGATNAANMALKMPIELAQAEMAGKKTQADMRYKDSQTALNDQKLGAVANILKGLTGNMAEGEAMPLDTQNRVISAINGKAYLPYSNIGNTGATYSGADGSVLANVENNPLLQKTLEVLSSQSGVNNARAAQALKLAELAGVKANAGGFAPRATTAGTTAAGGTRTGAGGANGNSIPRLYSTQELIDDGMGGKRLVTRVDYDAMREANAAIAAAGGNPLDINQHIAFQNGRLTPQAQGGEQPVEQSAGPVVDMRPDSPTAGQVLRPQAAADPLSDPQVLEQVRQLQAQVANGQMTDDQFKAACAQLGIY